MAKGLLRTLLSLHPPATRAKAARARRVRPVLPSRASELKYRFALNQVVAQCRRAGDDLAAGMRAHWPLPTADGRSPSFDSVAPGLDVLFAAAARRLGGLGQQAKDMAKLAARWVQGDVDEKLAENLLRAVGVDVSTYLAPDEAIGRAMREAAAANVELITSIPVQYLDLVKSAVEGAWSDGLRWEELTAQIKAIGDVTESRARLIARDQVSKMNASFNEVRQTSVGIEQYGWSGALDKRERPSHRLMEGTVHRWGNPPEVDGEHVHPGEAVLCRCAAIPKINFSDMAPDAGAEQQEAA